MMIYHDSISTTYRLSNGTTKAIKRGSNQSADNLKSVVLNERDRLPDQRFRRAYESYNQNLLIRVQSVILYTQTGAIRVAGVPFGGGVGVFSSKLFSVSNPMALAGFETAGSPQTGISGLSIVKNNMAE
ncbi:hypothetical protein C8J57DRAFT_532155 [Mycena rebaudengoi]|nr:hypothetical protein C8J57DRAFT_532155 [Mycena rebaudengoi]